MAFREIVAPTVKELFIQQLEGMILSGELRPGDRLPTERELADEMKISKTVVHEGLRELHRLGFLDIASRRGVTVADYAQTGSLETLMAIMDYHGSLPDEKTARSILRLRYYLEAPALRDLVHHINILCTCIIFPCTAACIIFLLVITAFTDSVNYHLCNKALWHLSSYKTIFRIDSVIDPIFKMMAVASLMMQPAL